MKRMTSRLFRGLQAATLVMALLMTRVSATEPPAASPGPEATVTPRVHIESSGYATVLHAPPSSRPVARVKRYEPEETRLMRELGVSLDDARRRVNPDEDTSKAARALHLQLQANVPDEYVGYMIVRDPYARFGFKFRRDAAAALARFTSDDRFIALEGGIPSHELKPEFDRWMARFIQHRIFNSGSIREFEGRLAFDINIEQSRFAALAAEERWAIPDNVDLSFAPPAEPTAIDPRLARLVRVFPQNARSSGPVTLEYSTARLILRDGCFRLQGSDSVESLVLFGRGVQLELDDEGYLVLFHPLALARDVAPVRVGEIVLTGGRGHYEETDTETRALRSACGAGPIVALGLPQSDHWFQQRYPPE